MHFAALTASYLKATRRKMTLLQEMVALQITLTLKPLNHIIPPLSAKALDVAQPGCLYYT